MQPDPSAVPLATLLAHRDWVRRLAGSLVRDDASIDDLEQDTWLAALRSPPRRAGAVRAWLSRVVRHHAFNAMRSSTRRRAREQAGSRPEHVRSAAAVVAEAEVHRRLVVAVLELAEPSRSTVLMRFFDGAPPREIARVMDVPVETVRTRLRRALEALRATLSGGGRDLGWLAALAPLGVVPHEVGGGAGAAVAASGGIAGGTVMTGKITLIAAGTLSLGAGFLGGQLSGGASRTRPDGEEGSLAARRDALELAPDRQPGRPAGADASTSPTLLAGGTPEPEHDGSVVEQRLRALEESLAAARATNAALVAWASGLGPAPRDVEAESRGLEQLSDAALFEAIRKLSSAEFKTPDDKRVGLDRVIQACRAYLLRSVEPAARGEVLTIQGSAWLRLGDAEKAEAPLEEALRVAGPTSREGRMATVQLAFVASYRKDDRRASELLFALARQPETARAEEAYLRYAASTYLAVVDSQQARVELRALMEEFSGSEDPAARRWLDAAHKQLERLDAAGAGR